MEMLQSFAFFKRIFIRIKVSGLAIGYWLTDYCVSWPKIHLEYNNYMDFSYNENLMFWKNFHSHQSFNKFDLYDKVFKGIS